MRVTDIIMSAPMVRAILREIEAPGTGKTETRRLAWTERKNIVGGPMPSKWQGIKPGDRIYVRENCRAEQEIGPFKSNGVVYAAGGDPLLVNWDDQPFLDWMGLFIYRGDPDDGGKPVPSIHMPRWASRLTLDVTAVKIERLQDISHEDAIAEGVERESADPPFYYVPGIMPHSLTAVGVEEPGGRYAERSYAKLWNHLHGPASWEANPEVVAITFKPYLCNVDRMAA